MSDLRHLVERHYEQVNTADYHDIEELFSPKVVTTVPGFGRMEGIEPFREFGLAFNRAFPDGRIRPSRFVEDGDVIMIEGTFTGTHQGPLAGPAGEVPPTGKQMTLRYADSMRVEDGRVVEHNIYFDSGEMLGQLGLMPQS